MSKHIAIIDGGVTTEYGVTFPAYPGCCAMGATIEEAIENARSAANDWLLAVKDLGQTVPEPCAVTVSVADVEEMTAGGNIVRLTVIDIPDLVD